jgi:DNA polymerase III epsilon subunit-like protein
MKNQKTIEPFLPPLERVVFFDIETTGFDPFVDRVVTVQVRHNGKTTIWKEWELTERRCIEEFFTFIDTVYRWETSFVGYNILKFDVPFIDMRLRKLSRWDKDKWLMLHSRLHWVDLYQFLGDAYYKAKHWYHAMAGSKSDTENAQIPDLYAKRDYETIVKYVEGEMQSMEAVYKGISNEPFYKELVKKRREIMGTSA